MEGCGAPRAAQLNETFDPTPTISSFGKLLNIGLARGNKEEESENHALVLLLLLLQHRSIDTNRRKNAFCFSPTYNVPSMSHSQIWHRRCSQRRRYTSLDLATLLFRFASFYRPKYALARSAFSHRFFARESRGQDHRLRGKQTRLFDQPRSFDSRESTRRMASLITKTDKLKT